VKAGQYKIIIRFKGIVQPADLDKVAGVIARYDQGARLWVVPILPPMGHALIESVLPNVCDEITILLQDHPHVASISFD
jgi:hypothetical protein